ncbi:PHP domain-like protein [Microthyrium microscopicum]|uniref:PHP domain-like protein n=1 Tax=Microthyrium microscopicum TaxID=703497 RepID=A0A6A6USZ7_9PEZI|nr:PHP domain-like protein [Microthyrium microscopicum]
MFYDLNVPWTTNNAELRQRIAFLAELGYNVIALSHILPAKLTPNYKSPITLPLPFPIPPNTRLLTRGTLPVSNVAEMPRLDTIRPHFDILALRPLDEKTLSHICASSTLEYDILSLDLSMRFPSHFRPKTFSLVLERGSKIEICYAHATSGGGGNDSGAKRALFQNASEIVRSTRGKGLLISSEAKSALGCRGPRDVVNMAIMWGLKQELGHEAVGEVARGVVAAATLRRRGYRGAVDVIDGGNKPVEVETEASKKKEVARKRQAESMLEDGEAPLTKKQMKNLAWQARKKEGRAAGADGKKSKGVEEVAITEALGDEDTAPGSNGDTGHDTDIPIVETGSEEVDMTGT